MNRDPVITQKASKRLRKLGGANLKEKTMRWKILGDAEDRGQNCAVCEENVPLRLGLLVTAVAHTLTNW